MCQHLRPGSAEEVEDKGRRSNNVRSLHDLLGNFSRQQIALFGAAQDFDRLAARLSNFHFLTVPVAVEFLQCALERLGIVDRLVEQDVDLRRQVLHE